MKNHFFKRALAIIIGAALVIGNGYAVQAQGSVSGGNVLSGSVSGGDAIVPGTEPTSVPTVEPTSVPTAEPTLEPTTAPTVEPTLAPTVEPTVVPTLEPTTVPTVEPSGVQMTTPVIMKAPAPVKRVVSGEVTVNHYLYKLDNENNVVVSDANMVFKPYVYPEQVEAGSEIKDFLKEEGYTISYVTVNGEDKTTDASDGELTIESFVDGEAVVNVFYTAVEGEINNPVVIYDYVAGSAGSWNGSPYNDKSINYNGNYDSNSQWNNRISARGTSPYYKTEVNGKNINQWHADDRYLVIKGLLTGLESSEGRSDYDIVNFTHDDPGFFSSEPKAGKEMVSGYSLRFERVGAAYQLESLRNADGNIPFDGFALDNFFFEKVNGKKNEYFGMRYDFTFKLGDYVGELNYSFTGDDDLWVCMDGDVVLDIGGIHTAVSGSVDLWKILLGKDEYTLQDKIDYVNVEANASKEYTITVLFMERGGKDSNCNMSFVVPQLTVKQPVVTSIATLNLQKEDVTTGTAMPGVSFTLSGNNYAQTLATDGYGRVSFGGLTAGTYTLTESIPEGYLADGPWQVTVREEAFGATVVSTISEIKNTKTGAVLSIDGAVYTITNARANTDLTFTKVDAENANVLLAGAEFKLVSESDATFEKIATSGSDGVVTFKEVPIGNYILTETKAPAGYVQTDNSWNVTVGVNKDSGKVEANIYADGNVVTSIANQSAASLLAVDKAAELYDPEKRIYKIDLNASLESEELQGAGVVTNTDATIVDYIDVYFELTDEEGVPLSDGAEVSDHLGNKGKVIVANEKYSVKWENVTIPSGSDGAAWSAEIYVTAKENFMGGNMISTNGEGSGVTVNDTLVSFERPTVNVELLDLALENDGIELFKGEQVTPTEYIRQLSNTLVNAPALDDAQWKELLANKILTEDYDFDGKGDKVGSFTYELKSADEWDDHEATEVGTEEYQLVVTYTADSIETRQKGMDGFEMPNADPNGQVGVDSFDGVEVGSSATGEDKGIYTVNVVAGSLVITKTLNASDIDPKQGDAIFTFKVSKDGEFLSYHTVRFTAAMQGEGTVTLEVANFEELGKGLYTVEELETVRYELVDVTAEGVADYAADVKVEGTTAVVGIGRTTDAEATVSGNRDAKVGFINEKEMDNNFSDTDVVVNKFVIGEDGTISWTGDSLENTSAKAEN